MMDDRAAYQELLTKSLREIQVETAYTWANRARAAYRLSRESQRAGKASDAMAWALDAKEYEHEALEHGALAGDAVLAAVRLIVTSN